MQGSPLTFQGGGESWGIPKPPLKKANIGMRLLSSPAPVSILELIRVVPEDYARCGKEDPCNFPWGGELARKIRAPIKIKSALPQTPKPQRLPPQNEEFHGYGFFLQKERIFPGVHKIGATHFRPQNCGHEFYGHEDFLGSWRGVDQEFANFEQLCVQNLAPASSYCLSPTKYAYKIRLARS